MFEGILQPTHLILILAIVLIIFGPGKLPQLGRTLGDGIREFRDSVGNTNSTPVASTPVAPTPVATTTVLPPTAVPVAPAETADRV
jgi:sec-independent protein translocase protein TatA